VRNYSDSARAEEYYERGVELEDNGELEAALEHYEKAVSEDPAFGDAYVEMAYIQLRLGDERRAVENLRKAIRVAGHPLAYYNLGWIYEGRDRPERAEMLYRRALEVGPEMADAHLGLGAILLNRGRVEEAAAHVERAAELDADQHYVTYLRESAVPRYREFAQQLADAGGIGLLGMKEQVYLDFGAIMLGSAGDDGVRIPVAERRRFDSPEEVAVTCNRFLALCRACRWRFTAVAAVDPDSEPLAAVIADRLDLPYWRPEQVTGPGRILLVAAALLDTREYFAALDSLEEADCTIFSFMMALAPSSARNLDYRSLPQAVGLLAEGRPYWVSIAETDDEDPVERLLADLAAAGGEEPNREEQVAWYARTHSHLNFPLWGLGKVRR
jgi:tetratricopeptide (TPR) repeat protein